VVNFTMNHHIRLRSRSFERFANCRLLMRTLNRWQKLKETSLKTTAGKINKKAVYLSQGALTSSIYSVCSERKVVLSGVCLVHLSYEWVNIDSKKLFKQMRFAIPYAKRDIEKWRTITSLLSLQVFRLDKTNNISIVLVAKGFVWFVFQSPWETLTLLLVSGSRRSIFLAIGYTPIIQQFN